MKMIRVAGGVVINTHGHVLLVEQMGGSWSFPKGAQEKGENLRQAATREIGEESGIRALRLIRYLATFERSGGGTDKNIRKRISMFLFFTRSRALRPEDPTNPQAQWFALEQVTARLTYREDKAFFSRARRIIDASITQVCETRKNSNHRTRPR